ncbi:hypothetical protein B0H63DRAFT_477547 [Podospora didyma]|uniref:2EXR domain-containing protein n=1 Tax=Podospora didyma TaxID=330526 RepID=A0AAE0KKC1_9PEZI|nr:hypothetical protein B0H63DRAFT_477547 [Podospora didyma]
MSRPERIERGCRKLPTETLVPSRPFEMDRADFYAPYGPKIIKDSPPPTSRPATDGYFHPFKRLPAEIRANIWNMALGHRILKTKLFTRTEPSGVESRNLWDRVRPRPIVTPTPGLLRDVLETQSLRLSCWEAHNELRRLLPDRLPVRVTRRQTVLVPYCRERDVISFTQISHQISQCLDGTFAADIRILEKLTAGVPMDAKNLRSLRRPQVVFSEELCCLLYPEIVCLLEGHQVLQPAVDINPAFLNYQPPDPAAEEENHPPFYLRLQFLPVRRDGSVDWLCVGPDGERAVKDAGDSSDEAGYGPCRCGTSGDEEEAGESSHDS